MTHKTPKPFSLRSSLTRHPKTFLHNNYSSHSKFMQNISLPRSVTFISGMDPRGSPHNNTPYKETEAKRIKMILSHLLSHQE